MYEPFFGLCIKLSKIIPSFPISDMGADIIRRVLRRAEGGRGRVQHTDRPSPEQPPSHRPSLEGNHQFCRQDAHWDRVDPTATSTGINYSSEEIWGAIQYTFHSGRPL